MSIGTHENGKITRKCDAALADGVVVKAGTDDNHVAVATAATENPIGVATSATDAAEDDVGVELFSAPGTKKGVALAAIAVGARLCAATAGKVQTLPTTVNGTYYVIGRAITAAAAAADEIEYEGCVPYPVVISGN
jgi:hypothetical protein